MNRLIAVFLVVPFLVLLTLLLMKAKDSSITHDEALSFITYAPQSFLDLILYNQDVSANNHLLNSIWMKALRILGTTSPFALRLLSISGFILAVYSLFLFFRKTPLWIRPVLVLIPLANPFLLDFFVLARSYGFSFGLMLLSLALLNQGLENSNHNKIRWAILAAIFATVGNFNLIYFYVPSFIVLAVFMLAQGQSLKDLFLLNRKVFITAFVAFVYVFYVFRKLKSHGQLYFGGNEWFGSHLINDQFWCLNYEKQYPFQMMAYNIWQIVYWALLLLPLLFLPFKELRKENSFKNWVVVWLVFLGASLLIEFNHRVLDSLYPLKRTALFMTLLFTLNLASFLGWLFSQQLLKIPTTFVIFALGGSLFYHVIISFPPLKFREIPYDYKNTEVLNLLDQIHSERKSKLDLSVNWQVFPAFEFYRQTQKIDWLPVFKREDIRPDAEYLYLFKEDFETIDTTNHRCVWRDQNEGLFLYQKAF